MPVEIERFYTQITAHGYLVTHTVDQASDIAALAPLPASQPREAPLAGGWGHGSSQRTKT